MRTYCLVFLTIIFISIAALPQPNPDTLWTRIYYGQNGYGYAAQQTSDQGYILAGAGQGIYVIKTDENGYTQWARNYGVLGAGANALQQTVDGGYIFAGYKEVPPNGVRSIYLVRTDSVGDTLWTILHGGSDYHNFANSVKQTRDGGFVVAGYGDSFGSGYYLFKVDDAGSIQWTHAYLPIGHGVAFSVQQTSDAGYVIGGTIFVPPVYDYLYVIRTDSIGDTVWTRVIEDAIGFLDSKIQVTNDDGYVVAGQNRLAKLSSSGGIQWSREIDVGCGYMISDVRQTPDGGYVLFGYGEFSPPLGYECLLVKTDSVGEVRWIRRYGGNRDDFAFAGQITSDGGYMLAGFADEYGVYGNYFYLVKTGPDPANNEVFSRPRSVPLEIALHSPYPNPFNASTTISYEIPFPAHIKLSIYNILGQRVDDIFDQNVVPGVHAFIWSPSRLASGIYFCRLQAGEFDQFQKLVLLK